jgi:phosphate butyryltransferase
MILRNFDELIGVAKVRGCRRVAVAKADDHTVLEGVALAAAEEMLEPILFGERDKIEAVLDELGMPRNYEIRDTGEHDRAAAEAAIESVRRGEAHLLMKGQLPTSTLFSCVLDKTKGLPRKGILSHIMFGKIDHYHKIFAMTDGGLNVAPDYAQRKAITQNAIDAFHALGYARPKVALLSYVEKVKKGDPETEQWRQLVKEAKEGGLGEAIVDGPLAMDLCLSIEAKRIKECVSEVAADADIIVAPNITACNASGKALLLAGGTAGGVVVGSSVPIVALSRGDSAKSRLCSLAIAIALLD